MTNKQLYDQATEYVEPNLCCPNIACDLITEATKVMSPKHLGMAVSLQHEYASRKLIEYMCAQGYYISYDELRRFLTSAALYVESLQEPSPIGAYKPPAILSRADGGKFISAAADNWDHNERTIDGKRTTHAMTSIFVQHQADQQLYYPRIPKLQLLH